MVWYGNGLVRMLTALSFEPAARSASLLAAEGAIFQSFQDRGAGKGWMGEVDR